jgi:hypothetical protein
LPLGEPYAMTDFIAIARHCLQPLAEQGFSLWDERLCRGEVRLECDRGDLQIRVSYEPFGPPWCDLHRGGRFERRLEIESGFPSGFFETHAEELEAWCARLLKRLDDEKIIAQPNAAPNGGLATQLGNSGVTEGPPSVS